MYCLGNDIDLDAMNYVYISGFCGIAKLGSCPIAYFLPPVNLRALVSSNSIYLQWDPVNGSETGLLRHIRKDTLFIVQIIPRDPLIPPKPECSMVLLGI